MKRALIILLAMLLLLSASACSKPAENNDPSAPAPAPAPAPVVADQSERDDPDAEFPERFGGTLRILTSVDGAGAFGTPWTMTANTHWVTCMGIDTLLLLNKYGEYENILAESYTIADDYSYVEFKLREGIKFHDGTTLNADAAVWNIQMWTKGNYGTRYFSMIESVEKTGDYTFRIHVSEYSSLVLLNLCYPEASFISPTAYSTHGQEWCEKNMVSTGPFMLTELSSGAGWSYTAFEDYYRGRPYLDAIEFIVVPEETTMQLMLQNGEADMALWASGGTNEVKLALYNAGFELMGVAGQDTCATLFPDSGNPDSPWSNELVRQAACYAIDFEGLEALGGGLWEAAQQIVPKSSGYYDETLVREYDPDKARALLAEAGYPDGFDTQIHFDNVTDYMILIQDNWKDVGINAEFVITDTTVNYAKANQGWDGLVIVPIASSVTLVSSVDWNFSRNSTTNCSMDKTDEIQRLLDEGAAAMSIEDQKQYGVELSKYIFEHAVCIPMYYDPSALGVRAANVRGGQFGQFLTLQQLMPDEIWIEKE